MVGNLGYITCAGGRICGLYAGKEKAAAAFGHLAQVIRHGQKKIQYQPGRIEGCCLAGQADTPPHGRPQAPRPPRPRAGQVGLDADDGSPS